MEIVFTRQINDKHILYRKSSNDMYVLIWDGEKFYNRDITVGNESYKPKGFDTEKEAIDYAINKGWFVIQRSIGITPSTIAIEDCPFYVDFINNQTTVKLNQNRPLFFDKISLGGFIAELEKIKNEMN